MSGQSEAFLGTSHPTPPSTNYDARVDNGLAARSYVPLGEISPADRDLVLTSLGRARIAAFVRARSDGHVHLYVDALEHHDAHAIVIASGAQAPSALSRRRSDATDTDVQFAALTEGWDVDTAAAIRAAVEQFERDADVNIMSDLADEERLTGSLGSHTLADDLPEDSDDDHFIPPAPAPLPQMRPITFRAILLIVLGLVMLGWGGLVNSESTMTAFLGSLGILSGATLLVMNMRPDHDDYDDGAVL